MSRASGLGPMPGWGGGGDLCGGSLQNVFSKRLPDVRSSTVRGNCGPEVASGEICSEKCCVSDTTGRKNRPRATIYTNLCPTQPNGGENPSGFSVPAGGKLPSQKRGGRTETADGLWPL